MPSPSPSERLAAIGASTMPHSPRIHDLARAGRLLAGGLGLALLLGATPAAATSAPPPDPPAEVGISIGDATVGERADGVASARFTVRLLPRGAVLTRPVTVTYQTIDGSAT